MGRASGLFLLLSLLSWAGGLAADRPAQDASLTALRAVFDEPPADARIMMRWWWFGPAVTDDEIRRELHAMKAAGIGGVEVQPVYPLALDDAATGIRTRPFLSDEFLAALRTAAAEARAIGLRFDLTLGSGWPFGGSTVAIADAAGSLRVERRTVAAGAHEIAVPALSAGETLIAAFLAPASTANPAAPAVRLELTAPRVALPGEASGREVAFFIAGRTGMQVKRAAVGAEGFVLDHYDRGALDRYLASVGDRLLAAFGPDRPYAVFCDSLESYGNDWTPDLLDEFARRRRYDLVPLLPALVSAADPDGAAVRQDWARTLMELVDERFVAPLHAWARRAGVKLRMQAYGTPPATLASSREVDLPEGEGADWTHMTAVRWAVSASHILGVPVTSAETWTWLHSPAFRAGPLDLKAEADRQFLQGVTQIVGHGWPYSPPQVEAPGWRFYAAAALNDRNPWWIAMPEVSRYLQRLSGVLRQGAPVADIAIYLPVDDASAQFTPGHVNLFDTLRARLPPTLLSSILAAGYTPELVDDGVLAGAAVENGRLRVGRQRYAAVVLPGVETLPQATLATLEGLAAGGGLVVSVGRVPSRAPGHLATPGDHAAIARRARALLTGDGHRGVRVDAPDALAAVLGRAVAPDAAWSPVQPEVGFVHRALAGADVYFVANTSNRRVRFEAAFRAIRRTVEQWDPVGGGKAVPMGLGRRDGRTVVPLILEPYGSTIIVLSDEDADRASQDALVAGPSGTMDIGSGWTISFGDGPAAPLQPLRSWTEIDGRRFFSGTATYARELRLPARLASLRRVAIAFGDGTPLDARPLQNGMRAWLEPPVAEAAVVYVNDVRAGAVWCPPYELDITRFLHPGPNALRVVVGNSAVNRMAGRDPPSYRLLEARYGVRFVPQDMDAIAPAPSGLLGPLSLRVTRR